MSFELVAYERLKISIKQSITTLFEHYKLSPANPEQSLQQLPEERRIQAQLLISLIDLLDKSSEVHNIARTLNAVTYYIHDQIAQTYTYSSPERSNFYTSLTTALELTKDNRPERNDLLDMYASLRDFLRAQVYVSADPRRGYVTPPPIHIKGFDVTALIKDLTVKVCDLEVKIIEDAKKLEALATPGGAAAGFFGVGGAKGKSPAQEHGAVAPKHG